MATTLTLREYEDAERRLVQDEGRRGFLIHAVITLIVWAVVIPINVFVASAFPWSALVVGGMTIGLAVHYFFGVRYVETSLGTHQRKVESLAALGHAG